MDGDLSGGKRKKMSGVAALKAFNKAKASLKGTYKSFKKGSKGYKAVCNKLARSKSPLRCGSRSKSAKKQKRSKSKSRSKSRSKKLSALKRLVCK